MSQPLVSVIMPVYNCADYVGQAIESVLSQDYAHLELIVVDDGSTDSTPAVLTRFDDARLRWMRQTNSGPAAARNRALALSCGDYIAFLDGDDLWLPGKLAAQMTYLDRHPDMRIVYSRWARWHADSQGDFAPATNYLEQAAGAQDVLDEDASGWIYAGMLLDSMIHSITAVVHRRVFDAIGLFDESLRTGEDYDLWLRATHRFRVAKLARTLALYRIHPQSVTAVEQRENNEYRVLMRALERLGHCGTGGRRVDRMELDRRLSRLCFDHGYRHYRRGDVRIAFDAFRLALRHSDFRPKTLAYCVGAAARCATSKVSSTLTGGLRES